MTDNRFVLGILLLFHNEEQITILNKGEKKTSYKNRISSCRVVLGPADKPHYENLTTA